MVGAALKDNITQETIGAIVTEVASAIDAEGAQGTLPFKAPGGPEVGRQVMIDATEKDGLMNRCRFSILNPELAPAGEVARIEYEHDKQGQFGVRRVYSVQSVRKNLSGLVLMENFLAESAATVREADFRPISSEAYARATVLSSVQNWARYRAWQRQEAAKGHG